jgi:hypothetical protein
MAAAKWALSFSAQSSPWRKPFFSTGSLNNHFPSVWLDQPPLPILAGSLVCGNFPS